MKNEPSALPGASVLPPMDTEPSRSEQGAGPRRAKGKPKRRHGDRFAVLNAFADYSARLINTTAQACWWIVYRETKPDGLARVTHQRIADCVGVKRVTVTRAMQRLERAGLLTVVRRGGLRSGPSTYRVHGVPKGEAKCP